MSKFLLGTDPEFFLMTKEGSFVSAHDKLPGNKKEPYKVKHGAVQVDGLACEFNIDPASSGEEFEHNIHAVLKELRKMIDPQLKFNFSPTVQIPKQYFQSLPDECKELGCDPDFNVYLKGFNKIPDNIPMRTGSGHLHFGWTKGRDIKDPDHVEDCEALVLALDNTLERLRWAWDGDRHRQTMYGSRGSYRAKPYGVEYRVLSNAWLKYPDMWRWLFDMSKAVYDCLVDNGNEGNYPYIAGGLEGHSPGYQNTFQTLLYNLMTLQKNGQAYWPIPYRTKNMFAKKLEM